MPFSTNQKILPKTSAEMEFFDQFWLPTLNIWEINTITDNEFGEVILPFPGHLMGKKAANNKWYLAECLNSINCIC